MHFAASEFRGICSNSCTGYSSRIATRTPTTRHVGRYRRSGSKPCWHCTVAIRMRSTAASGQGRKAAFDNSSRKWYLLRGRYHPAAATCGGLCTWTFLLLGSSAPAWLVLTVRRLRARLFAPSARGKEMASSVNCMRSIACGVRRSDAGGNRVEQCKIRWAIAIVLSIVGTGCGDFKFPAGSGADTSAAEKGPGRVIAEFLESVRTGDDQRAASLLTPLARQRTAEMQMVVAPPGSDTAKFQLRDVELVADGAHVATDWTDLDTDGHARTDRIIWICAETPRAGTLRAWRRRCLRIRRRSF